jgi:dihydrolipoamide dehydrogenase
LNKRISPGERPWLHRSFDVIVIGAGPGGYVAAIRASQLGLKVAIVEREHMGGICLNWGCIPTKAMLRSSEVFHLMHRAKDFGLKAEGISYDLDAVVKRSRGVAKQLNSGVGHLMKKNKVTVVMGEATLPAKGKVSVKTDKGTEDADGQEHHPRHRRAGARACRGWRPMASGSGPTSTR